MHKLNCRSIIIYSKFYVYTSFILFVQVIMKIDYDNFIVWYVDSFYNHVYFFWQLFYKAFAISKKKAFYFRKIMLMPQFIN